MNKIFDIVDFRINKFLVNTEYSYLSYEEKDEEIDLYVDGWDHNLDLKRDIGKKNNIKISINVENEIKNSLFSGKNNIFKANLDRSVINYISNLENKNLNNFQSLLDNINFSFSSSEDNLTNFTSKQDKKFTKNLLSSYDVSQKDYPFIDLKQNINLIKDVSFSNKYSKDILLSKFKNNFSRNLNVFDFYANQNNIESELISSEYSTKNLRFKDSLNNFIDTANKEVSNEDDEKTIFEKYKYFKILPVTSNSFPNLLDKIGCVLIGFLIRKHKKSKEGNILLNIANQFIKYDSNSPTEINLFDESVSYGSSYSYEIFPVFCSSISTNLNGFIEIAYYLICSQSYKTLFERAVDYFQPQPPNALRAKFMYNLNKVKLEWDTPNNPENDVVGYQIYRRKNLDEAYELIALHLKKSATKFKNFDMFSDIIPDFIPIDIDNMEKQAKKYFIDNIDNINELYIYTICAVDSHGMVSNYSNQIAVRYSQTYNKLIIDNISLADAPRQYPNLYLQRKSLLFENDNLLFNFTPFFKNKEKIKIYFTPDSQTLKVDNKNFLNVFTDDYRENFHLNIVRLTDLNSKSIKFSLK